MLKIQEYMSYYDSMDDALVYLKRNLNIDHEDYALKTGRVVLLKPGHRADMANPLVREANCLVLDEDAWLLAKAWNHPTIVNKPEDLLPGDFKLSKSTCEETPDGKVVVVYNIDKEWIIGTDSSVEDSEVKKHLEHCFTRWDKPFQNINPFLCFIFNYVSPDSGSVMPILTRQLYLTGAVNLETGNELPSCMLDSISDRIGIHRPHWADVYGASSLTQRICSMRTLAPGLMLRDEYNNRVFIPNPIHSAVHYAKMTGELCRPSHVVRILQACRDKADVTSIAASYKNIGPMLELLWKVQYDLFEELIMLWSVVRHYPNMKDFGMAVQHHPLRHILFMFKNEGSGCIKTEIDKLKPLKLTRIAENKWEKEYISATQLLKFTGGTNGDSKVEEENQEDSDNGDQYFQEGD